MEEKKKDKYLNVFEVADWLNLSSDTIRKKHKKDPDFPAPIGFSKSDFRWKESEVNEWLSKKEAERANGANS